MGKLAGEVAGWLQRDPAQKVGHRGIHVAVGHVVDLQRADQVVPDLVHRVERGEWILEDHLDLRCI